jgi:flagellar motor switch protein FliN/FliY
MTDARKPGNPDVDQLLRQITGEGVFPADAGAAGAPLLGQDALLDVPLNVRIELGRTRMRLEDILRVGRGSVIPLDQLAGEPLDIYVNDRLVARGEVLILRDNFCVRVTEVLGQKAR